MSHSETSTLPQHLMAQQHASACLSLRQPRLASCPALLCGDAMVFVALSAQLNVCACGCRLSGVGSSNSLSPSTTTSLSRFSSSEFNISPGVQLTSPLASGLSSNSSNTNQGFAYLGSPTQNLAMSAYPSSPVEAAKGYRGPNPMAGHDWLPQNPSLAVQLGQMRNEKQKTRAPPLDFMEGFWGFDEFPPVPGTLPCMYLLIVHFHIMFQNRSTSTITTISCTQNLP